MGPPKNHQHKARWWFQIFFSPLSGEDVQFDEHIFQMGWNHQPERNCRSQFCRNFTQQPWITVPYSWIGDSPKKKVHPKPPQPTDLPPKKKSSTNLLGLNFSIYFLVCQIWTITPPDLSTQQRYTGGTIGMMKGPDGSLRPEPGELQRRLTKIEELNQAQPLGRFDAGWLGVSRGGMWQMAVGWFLVLKTEKADLSWKKDLCFFVVFRKIGCLISYGEGMRIVPLMGGGWIMNFQTTFGCVFNKILDLELECGMECHDMWRLSWVDYWPPPTARCLRIVFLSATWRNLILSWIRQTCGWPLKHGWQSGVSLVGFCLKNPPWK